LKKHDSEKLRKTRQELVDLLKKCEWDLISEKYKEASGKIDEIKSIMDKLIVDLIADEL
jgi:hypothetical protein